MAKRMIILQGLPASGKTSWAMRRMELIPSFVRVSAKDLEFALTGKNKSKLDKFYYSYLRDELIRSLAKQGKSIIVDDYNLGDDEIAHLKELAKGIGYDYEVNSSFMKVPVEECVVRDIGRNKSLGQNEIYKMYYSHLVCSQNENIERDKKQRAVIVDIDGTLAHKCQRGVYDYSKVKNDIPDPFVSAMIDSLDFTFGDDYLKILIVTGRDEECRSETEEWLEKNCIPYHSLLMRQHGDVRDDVIVKEQLYKKKIESNYCVLGVIDDRPKVCRMWRKLGLKTLQLGPVELEF